MFTGIVEDVGTVEAVTHEKNLAVLKIKAGKVLKGTKPGDSIAVDGVCLTVTRLKAGIASFDIMKETLQSTTLGDLKKGDRVNLERALRLNDRLSGHYVSGHVDGVLAISDMLEDKNYTEMRISLKNELSRFIVEKGAVCIDGVSLTVGKVGAGRFSVYLIPFTKNVTTLGLKQKGDKVNIETDILAKYVLNSLTLDRKE